MAEKSLSKLRNSIASVYGWRLGVNGDVSSQYAPKSDAERLRLAKEADYAFRQAFALCPYSPETIYLYVNFLVSQQRRPDALLVAKTASHLDAKNHQWLDLLATSKK
jgi:hypothetical protein